MSQGSSLLTKSIVYVPRYCLSPKSKVYVFGVHSRLQSTVYVSRVQFKSQEYSLCPQSAVYVLRVQFMSQGYSLCPQSTVYVLIVQFMSSEYSFISLDSSLCCHHTVYVLRCAVY